MIPFNIPVRTGREMEALQQVLATARYCGDGPITRQCEKMLAAALGSPRVLLTPSCTHALEIAAMLLNIGPGDEVILPSFTFVSTANAFALRGAELVFVDIEPRSLNIDPDCIRAAVTTRTKAIAVMHYAGVACDMDAIGAIALDTGAAIVEDAAQCIGASFRGKPLGSFGVASCFSFHETKNIHCGEGGALAVNDPTLMERAEILREKGTNRSNFLRGQIDKYTWVDIGSSYLPSELNAAFLQSQLEDADTITQKRLRLWRRYQAALRDVRGMEIPDPPQDCNHNAHIFWVKAPNEEVRNGWIQKLRNAGVDAPFHYVPLHSTGPGRRYGRFHGEDRYTTLEAGRLVRLPLHITLSDEDQDAVITAVRELVA